MLVPPPHPKKNTRIAKFKDPLGTIATNVQTTGFFAQQLHLNLAINPKSLSSPRRNGHFHRGPERSGPRVSCVVCFHIGETWSSYVEM